MIMHKLLERVEKELDGIGDKGLNSSNLDTTYKLIDIYKDIKESEYYDTKINKNSYNEPRRDGRGRYMEYDRDFDKDWERDDRYERFGPMGRYFLRLEDEVDNYNMARNRYRKGGSQDRVVDGIDMVMEAIHKMVECLIDYAETSQEKEIIRKHIDKMKNI